MGSWVQKTEKDNVVQLDFVMYMAVENNECRDVRGANRRGTCSLFILSCLKMEEDWNVIEFLPNFLIGFIVSIGKPLSSSMCYEPLKGLFDCH